MHILRGRLSYANVTATLALFVGLGGSTYAATKISGKDIAKRTITAKNVKRGTLTGSELSRGAVTASKLSAGLRAKLPSEDDFGTGGEGIPGLDGLPGLPGLDGEPGPPGSSCPAEQGLLCGDADLPASQVATVVIAGTPALKADAYRTSCAPVANDPDCTVLLAGTTQAIEAAAFYGSAAPRDFVLTVGTGTGTTPVVRRFNVAGAVPTSLRTQTDRWQLALDAQSVTETAP